MLILAARPLLLILVVRPLLTPFSEGTLNAINYLETTFMIRASNVV